MRKGTWKTGTRITGLGGQGHKDLAYIDMGLAGIRKTVKTEDRNMNMRDDMRTWRSGRVTTETEGQKSKDR